MTELLSRLFVKNHKDATNPAVRTAYGTMVSITGIILNLILFAAKFVVGSLFGAISIVGDAVNNLSDAGTQIISLISFRIAAKPADREHPFGHARIEYVTSMIVSFLVILGSLKSRYKILEIFMGFMLPGGKCFQSALIISSSGARIKTSIRNYLFCCV